MMVDTGLQRVSFQRRDQCCYVGAEVAAGSGYRRRPTAHRVVRNAVADSVFGDALLALKLGPLNLVELVGVQHLSAESLEAVAAADPIHQPDQVVHRLDEGVGHAVIEVVEDLRPPVFHGGPQILEGPRYVVTDAVFPRAVILLSLHPAGAVVETEERLLGIVGVLERGIVRGPAGQQQVVAVRKLRSALEQHETIVHEPTPRLGRQRSPVGLAHGLQRGVGHPHDMKLVYDDGSARQHQPRGITVRRPHVHRDDLHSLPIGHAGEVIHDRSLVAVGQHVDDRVFADIADDGPRLFDDVDFVDAQPFGRLESDLATELLDVGGEDAPHRALGDARLFCDMRKGALDRLASDPVHQAFGHVPSVIDIGMALEESLAAGPAAKAPAVNVDADAPPLARQIANQALVPAEADDSGRGAVDAGAHGLGGLCVDVQVVVAFFHADRPQPAQAKKVDHCLARASASAASALRWSRDRSTPALTCTSRPVSLMRPRAPVSLPPRCTVPSQSMFGRRRSPGSKYSCQPASETVMRFAELFMAKGPGFLQGLSYLGEGFDASDRLGIAHPAIQIPAGDDAIGHLAVDVDFAGAGDAVLASAEGVTEGGANGGLGHFKTPSELPLITGRCRVGGHLPWKELYRLLAAPSTMNYGFRATQHDCPTGVKSTTDYGYPYISV